MSLVYTLTSHDPTNYGTLKFNASPLIDSKIRYRIKSLSTYSYFSITTADDFIIISREGQTTKYYFEDRCSYNLGPYPSAEANLLYEIEQVINKDICPTAKLSQREIIPTEEGNDYHIHVSYTTNGLMMFSCAHKINIIDASHRVKMITGLYHTTLPMKEDYNVVSDSIPLSCFGNVLYLKSKSGIVIGTNELGSEQYKSICYKCLELLVPGLPLVSKSPGYLMTIGREDMSQLEFELVDFMMEPVILHAPMHLTLEVYYTGYDLVPINTNEFTYNNLAV